VNGQIQYGLFRPMTSVVTREPANLDLPRRLATFRHELRVTAHHLTRASLDHLATLARELNLQDQEIENELEEIHAWADALDLADDIARGILPVIATRATLPEGDVCHFAMPVRFGRRRTDQFGHLELTDGWLKFRAALDVSVAWSEVAQVHRTGREVIVTLADSTRLLRFWCPCISDAARAAVLAEHLSDVAHGRTTLDTTCHACG
jgi:hypothetical protein